MKALICLILCLSCTREGGFKNTSETPINTGVSKLKATWALFFEDSPFSAPPQKLPIKPLKMTDFKEDYQVAWLGHASVLIKMREDFFLTDPVLGERVSPVEWIGPKRFHDLPLKIEELPKLKAIFISHDHHDHLDYKSVLQLNERTEKFITPLKVGSLLKDWGIPENKIIELNWWQSTQLDSFTFTCTPAQHFSGRGLWGWNETLWSSWVIQDAQKKVFFGGDTGMFSGFQEISQELGSMDLTLLPIGAYDKLWSSIHLFPHEALEAHRMLEGKKLMPIHWGTFDLSRHAWDEPLNEFKKNVKNDEALLGLPGEIHSF